MTEEERKKLDAWVLKMAELDPGLCVSAGGEPYREFIGPRPAPHAQQAPEPQPPAAPAEQPAPGAA